MFDGIECVAANIEADALRDEAVHQRAILTLGAQQINAGGVDALIRSLSERNQSNAASGKT